MAIELDIRAKELVAAAIARGDFTDEQSAVNAAILAAFDDDEQLQADIAKAIAQLDSGQGISLEDWLTEREKYWSEHQTT